MSENRLIVPGEGAAQQQKNLSEKVKALKKGRPKNSYIAPDEASRICKENGLCVVTELAQIAKQALSVRAYNIALQALSELLPYVHPKLKAVEVKADQETSKMIYGWMNGTLPGPGGVGGVGGGNESHPNPVLPQTPTNPDS